MAHHKSAKKRIRQIATRRARNRYYAKTTRNLIRDLKASHEKGTAVKLLPTVISNIDKLAKKGNIHKNKAANLKSKLTKLVNAL